MTQRTRAAAAAAAAATPFLLLVTTPTHAAGFADIPEIRSLTENLPEDVASYIARHAECEHWSAETPIDSDRAAFLMKATTDARCQELSQEEQALKKKYRKNDRIRKALKKCRTLVL